VEMSQYYARGSAYAKDFIGDDKDHFAREWQNTQAECVFRTKVTEVSG